MPPRHFGDNSTRLPAFLDNARLSFRRPPAPSADTRNHLDPLQTFRSALSTLKRLVVRITKPILVHGRPRIKKSRFAAGVIDWQPSSENHRLVARALKEQKVRFLFHATHAPEDVTTVRGAPIFLKPGRPEEVVQALALLVGASK
jgi:hypothetical protein